MGIILGASRHPTDVPFVHKFWMGVVLFRRYEPTKNPILAIVAVDYTVNVTCKAAARSLRAYITVSLRYTAIRL